MNTCKGCKFFNIDSCHVLPPVRSAHGWHRPVVRSSDVACIYFKKPAPQNEVKK